MRPAQCARRREPPLGPARILFLDKYGAAFCEAADHAEYAVNHLRIR